MTIIIKLIKYAETFIHYIVTYYDTRTHTHTYILVYIYTVVATKEFSENKVLIIVNVELYQSKLHLLPHVVTLCFTYADDNHLSSTCLKIIVVIGVCETQCHKVQCNFISIILCLVFINQHY